MEFLNKTFTSKEDLSNFIKDYCYNFGYLTFIRSSSNKKGLVRIMCNSTGATKSGARGSPPASKKQKFGDCPFVACGRRISEAVDTTPESWQITIFNNSHNHLPVIDFSAPSTLNVSGTNIIPGQGISAAPVYNSVLDIYETNMGTQQINNHGHNHSHNIGDNNTDNGNAESSQNLTLHTDLFTTRIIQNISNKLKELGEEEKKVFLNRFNKLLYEDMPKFRARGETIEDEVQQIGQEHLYNPPPASIVPTIVNTSRVTLPHNCTNCGEPGHDSRNCSSVHNQRQHQQQSQQNQNQSQRQQHQSQEHHQHQQEHNQEEPNPRLDDRMLSYLF
jgi:hypothetical protein